MAKAEIGKEFVFLVDLNTSTTTAGERWARVGKSKDGGLTLSNNLVDTTTKDDQGFTSQVITTRSWGGSFSTNYDPFDPAADFISRKQHDTTTTDYRLKVRFDEPSGQSRRGFARVENMEMSTPVDGPAEMSISLTGDGALSLL